MEGLSVKNLSLAFSGITALKSVSFEVKPGEIVGLIGPNGAGKTSLINCISRYYTPFDGEISFYGQNLLEVKSHQLARIGISRSFQDLNLPGSLSVLENVMLGQQSEISTKIWRSLFDFGYLKREEHCFARRARDVMRFFADVRAASGPPAAEADYPDLTGRGGYPDLIDIQDVPTSMLPFGIKKKLDLARSFALKPKLLLLDEPASGLSASDQGELIGLIRGANKKLNTGILLIEHRMSMVMNLCQRVIVLNFGEKIADGAPSDIKNDPVVIEAYLGSRQNITKRSVLIQVQEISKPDEVKGDALLELRKVDVQYGQVKALTGVSINIVDRAITAVLGSNGAGKSSLLRAISGIVPLANGEIHFQNTRIGHYLQKSRPDQIVRKGIVHVAEGRRIFRELSIMENLKIAGYTLGVRRRTLANIEKVFHYFPELKSKLALREAGNLSGGQQQMVAIGQALMMEPRLLLLDEPSLGLSPVLVEQLFEIIMKINGEEKCAILLVEQNAEKALESSNYAFVLETGFIVKSGPSAELANDSEMKTLYLGG